jgi:hypothetical protein
MPVVIIVIPVVGALIKRFIDGALDLQRVQKIDTIAEGVLGLIMINNPKLDILEDIDKIKDMLVSELLKDSTVPLSNPLIASRVAASAIVKAQS